MKLFVALDVNENFRTALTRMQGELIQGLSAGCDEKGIVSPADFHLTLRYIGACDDAGPIVKRLSAIRFAPFSLTTASIGTFDQNDLPVVWAGVGNAVSALHTLKRQVDAALEGYPCAEAAHDFVPHITLAYLDQPIGGSLPPIPAVHADMTVRSMGLYEITSHHEPSTYRRIHSFPAEG